MALTVAQSDWVDAKSRNEVVGVMAFDLSAAFNTLEHSKLLSKLNSAGITGIQLKWFESYLSGRLQSTLWNGVISKSLPIINAVRQGSILRPNLFLAMIHDQPRCLKQDTPKTLTKTIEYVDDTTVYAHSGLSQNLMKLLRR